MPKGLDDEEYKQILARQFSLVVPDYGMYMSDLQPRRGVWDFASADRIVEFARTHQLKIRGHVLVYDFVKQFRQRGVPVDAVGLQFHLVVGLDNPNAERIEKNFARFHALGVQVNVTELDVRIPAPVTEQKLAEQARLYSLVMNTALRSPSCAGLTVWGYTDKYSWIDTFNAFPGYVNACLFAADLRPKSFFPSLLRDLESTSRDGGK